MHVRPEAVDRDIVLKRRDRGNFPIFGIRWNRRDTAPATSSTKSALGDLSAFDDVRLAHNHTQHLMCCRGRSEPNAQRMTIFLRLACRRVMNSPRENLFLSNALYRAGGVLLE